MSHFRSPDMPFCSRCGVNIDPSDAVPYVDRFGRPIPGQYRNWCLVHWAGRSGALPPNHPDFLIPRDLRTKSKDRRHLAMKVDLATMHGDHALRGYAQALYPELTELAKPIKPDVFQILRHAGSPQSMFPEFEWVGNRVASLGPEERAIIWTDFDNEHPELAALETSISNIEIG
jgi:hypothetical protein